MRLRLVVLAVAACLALVLWNGRAEAYPWMIRHAYTGCTPCHHDPTGSGLLTEYGRAQAWLLLSTNYRSGAQEQEVSPSGGFLFGLVQLPPWLLLSGYVREAELWTKVPGSPANHRLLQMQYDLMAGIRAGGFRAAGSIGYLPQGGLPAAVSTGQQHNVVSREHWAGYASEDDKYLVRAGRMNLPFGVRNVEHTLWVRVNTRTDLNDTQQHGVAFAYNTGSTRAEVMAIAGNYQIKPDDVRERGYSGFIERSLSQTATVGLSSLVTHAKRDRIVGVPLTRQAHGVFTRLAPLEPLVILAEANLLISNPAGTQVGYAGYLQADVEVIQGVHLMSTTEAMDSGAQREGMSYGGWLSAAWFFAPHADIRFDAIGQRLNLGSPLTVQSYLAQVHGYL